MFIHINNKMIDIAKFLTELKEEQLKKLEELNKTMENSGNIHTSDTNGDASTQSKCENDINSIFKNNKTSFRLPISYVADKKEINQNILNDLELIESKDPLGDSLYATIFKPKSTFGKRFLNDWSRYYTTDVVFLKESQQFYKSYENQYGGDLKAPVKIIGDVGGGGVEMTINPHEVYDVIDKLWVDIAGDVNFKQRFNYIDIPILERLNKSPGIMQLLSVYNLSSPVISLLSPIILMIIPFFILRFQKIEVTVSGYISTLKKIFATHPIGKMFSLMDFSSLSWDKRIYILMSFIFYVVQVYQNIMSCHRFYKNMILIHKNIFILRDYFTYTINNMSHILKITGNLNTYSEFRQELQHRKDKLETLCDTFSGIKPFKLSFSKLMNIGKIMKINYELFVDNDIKECVNYSFGFNAYYEHVDEIKSLIDSGKINTCVYIDKTATESEDATDVGTSPKTKSKSKPKNKDKDKDKKKKKSKNISTTSATSATSATSTKSEVSDKTDTSEQSGTVTKKVTKFMNIYYPPYENPIKNDVVIDKKIIITGPNAAGKTTVIKSILLNIILSQQIGYGYYENAEITPYDYLHCYLNIPDTSGRDSLFQAESRRCKEILDCLEKEKDKKHFCIFDELYSGTNPYEAVASAYGYIDHISNMKNVDLMLTTHYIQLCKNLKTNKNVKNYHMEVNVKSDYNVEYMYKYKKGISKIKGGIKVLYDLEYPESIIEKTKQLLTML
jgi:ABC-type multidrug transport system fused ATPase/permease subunit